ncbi:hypothetical protein [Streptomyces sindenensis]|uniref:hypothetical protein n=1 Tax=Streptomyces sindenensis TaxID=67363 RepID=UPI001678573D|nr:hypothetical protein [Streptomyces sindenensis]
MTSSHWGDQCVTTGLSTVGASDPALAGSALVAALAALAAFGALGEAEEARGRG